MAKGYWIGRVTVHDPERYKGYTEANAAAFRKYGGRFLARGGKAETLLGEGRARNVVIEFPDFDSAIACFRSAQYQHAVAVRGDSAEVDLVVVEGYEGPQPADD
jgi:uncharacterized protein (DUF1330 family)